MMKTTRRQAMKTAAASVCAASFLGVGARAADSADALDAMRPLDYGLSFVCCTASFNSARFWVESRTRIIDPVGGSVTDYYQCGSCKSEHTFAERNLFHEDNYDFLPILGPGSQWLVFRRPAGLSDRYRSVASETWGEAVPRLKEASEVVVLDTWERIRDATAAAVPIVTQTELLNEETGLRAVIECPCKTMNISLDKQMYQIDTGPVAFPDLTRRYEPPIDCLRLAFIAFNAPHFADFVVEQPTPVSGTDTPDDCRIYHYSNPFSLPARNRVIALGTW